MKPEICFNTIHDFILSKTKSYKFFYGEIKKNGIVEIEDTKLDFFSFFSKTIISQQISFAVAEKIWGNVQNRFDNYYSESKLDKNKKVRGVVVLKGAENISNQVEKNYINLFNRPLNNNVQYLHQYHFGGYAKHSTELINFIRVFYKETGIKTDPIYSGKLFFALIDQLKKDDDENKTIIALHSGGLSGIPGYENRYKIKLFS